MVGAVSRRRKGKRKREAWGRERGREKQIERREGLSKNKKMRAPGWREDTNSHRVRMGQAESSRAVKNRWVERLGKSTVLFVKETVPLRDRELENGREKMAYPYSLGNNEQVTSPGTTNLLHPSLPNMPGIPPKHSAIFL